MFLICRQADPAALAILAFQRSFCRQHTIQRILNSFPLVFEFSEGDFGEKEKRRSNGDDCRTTPNACHEHYDHMHCEGRIMSQAMHQEKVHGEH